MKINVVLGRNISIENVPFKVIIKLRAEVFKLFTLVRCQYTTV